MDETNEVEALAKVLFDENEAAYAEADGTSGFQRCSWADAPENWKSQARRVAIAVRDAVLASLAALGGEVADDTIKATLEHGRTDGDGLVPVTVYFDLVLSAAAKSRTIAALQQRVTELELERDAARVSAGASRDLRAKSERERDAYKRDWQAELDGARSLRKKYGALENETFFQFVERIIHESRAAVSRAEQAEVREAELRGRYAGARARAAAAENGRIAAESALATLLNAVQRGMAGGFGRFQWDAETKRYARPHSAPCGCTGCELYDATHAPETGNDSTPSKGSEPIDATAPGLAACVPVEARTAAEVAASINTGSEPGFSEHHAEAVDGAVVVRPNARPVATACEPVKSCTCAGEGTCAWCDSAVMTRMVGDAMSRQAFPVKPETLRTHVNRAKAQRSPEPTEAYDWDSLRLLVARCGSDDDGATFGRLLAARERAAEEMRERCASEVYGTIDESRARIRALPLKP